MAFLASFGFFSVLIEMVALLASPFGFSLSQRGILLFQTSETSGNLFLLLRFDIGPESDSTPGKGFNFFLWFLFWKGFGTE